MQDKTDSLERLLAGEARPEDSPAERQMAELIRRAIDTTMDADIPREVFDREREIGLARARAHWARMEAESERKSGGGEQQSWLDRLREMLLGGRTGLSPNLGAAFALVAVVGAAALITIEGVHRESDEPQNLTRGGNMTVLRLPTEDPGAKALEIVASLSGAAITATLETHNALRIIEIPAASPDLLAPILKQYGLQEDARPPMQILISPRQ